MPVAALARLFPVLVAATALSGCEVVEGIFKAGMFVGIFIVLAVIALVAFLAAKVRRRV